MHVLIDEIEIYRSQLIIYAYFILYMFNSIGPFTFVLVIKKNMKIMQRGTEAVTYYFSTKLMPP